jgi:hypothetical protein
MRHLPIALSLLATACAPQHWPYGTEGNAIVPDMAYPDTSGGPAAPAQTGFEDPPIYPAKEALFGLPEGTLPTECSAGAAYPDGKVQPGFYAYPSPPENDRYMDCLLAEAKRDGGTVRVASPSSFPRVGTCYESRVVEAGTGRPGHREGPSWVIFENKLALFDYGYIAPVTRMRVGDRVRACVWSLPKDCPSHDLRGIAYRIENLRTRERFVTYDSQHMCRGA